MRDVLFRGKRIDGEEYQNKWKVGFYHIKSYLISNITHHYIKSHGNDFEVIPETIGQYIGLWDKNDNKLYEGDIVRVKHLSNNELDYTPRNAYGVNGLTYFRNYAIEYNKNRCAFILRNKSDQHTINQFRDIEIIGNVHDNIELLKGAE